MSQDSERELASRLERIEARLAALESRLGELAEAPPEAPPEPPAAAAAAAPSDLPDLLALAGRAFLVLGGAFLVRALAQSGAISTAAGVGVGMLYVIVWIVAVALAARAGRRASATVHGLCALAIGAPLVGEAVARFGVLSPAAGSVALVIAVGVPMSLAALHGLRLLAWCATLGGAAAALALLPATHALIATGATMLTLALAAAALAELPRAPDGPRWLLAALADLVVLFAVLLVTRAGGPPAAYAAAGPRQVLALALALAAGYLGILAAHTLVLRRDVGAFEIAQSFAASALGVAGAARAALALGGGTLLGAGAVAAGVACGAAAFASLDREPRLRRSFQLGVWLGFALVVAGTALLLPAGWRPTVWIALALAVGALGARRRRWTPSLQSAVLVVVAALAAGAPRFLWRAFADAPATLPGMAAPAWWAVAGGALAAHCLLRRWASEERWARRLPVVLPAVVWMSAVLVALVLVLYSLLGGASDPARLALARTFALVLAAVALAAARRWAPVAPLAGASSLLLALAALKLVAEDLRLGDAREIFLGFGAFGAALLAVARLRRGRGATPAGGRKTKPQGEGPREDLP